MEDSVITDVYACFIIAIVVITWLSFALRAFILSYKHDSYIEKNFPELSKTESLSVFSANWDVGSVVMNIFSSTKTAPDEYASIMRMKIRHSIYGIFLSMTVLPFGLYALLVLFWALRYWLGF
jgi:hypothetical protein